MMGTDSKISWTDHTLNPWIGCARVSPGCLHCYAEARNDRYGEGLWGKDAPRRVTSDANWRQPLKWDRDAAAAGRPAFVFCASLADVFEDRPDLVDPRHRLWRLIETTPHLVWMLLTKRPQHIPRLVPWAWRHEWPRNVWIGTTVEDQVRALERVAHLSTIPAPVKFLSCEPLLGPVVFDALHLRDTIDWVIVGGESGPKHRPMNLDDARGIIRQCRNWDIPVWFKQVGGNVYIDGVAGGDRIDGHRYHERPTP